MSESDDIIVFTISAEKTFPKGQAMLLVSYQDYALMQKLGWNMEKPDPSLGLSFGSNKITFKKRVE